jgi:pyridoxine 5-phosphate synthase
MNLELAVTEPMLQFAEEIKPEHACLVPERREELTTEGGLDIMTHEAAIANAIQRLEANGSQVSLFIDPTLESIKQAADLGASVIEIHTGAYADALSTKDKTAELERIKQAAELAHHLGLIVNAGHGLNYQNVKPIAAIKEINELNIGHAIIARALFTGLKEAVKQMRQLMMEVQSKRV